MPKVSILMPVYNAERYLAQAIDSIINQSFTDWELIIINDGSTDQSKSIIESYNDPRIKHYENEANLKLIKTLNKGIGLCTGEYIARMDSDDISQPERLQIQVDFLDKHPSYVMCGTNARVVDNGGKKIGKIRNLKRNNFLQINLLFSNPFVHPSVVIRRKALENNHYDEYFKHIEDYELWCRVALEGKIANICKDLILYRWHSSNVSVVHNDMQMLLKNEVVKQQLQELDIIPTEKELYCHRITFRLYVWGKKQNVSVEDFDDVDKWFSKLIRINRRKERYSQPDFIAYLWSRWIVLCISQKKYGKMFKPRFASYKLPILWKVFGMVYYLSKKK